MKKAFIALGMTALLLGGCSTSEEKPNKDAPPETTGQDEESNNIEAIPRMIGKYQEDFLDLFATHIRNRQNSTGTYESFVGENFYSNQPYIQVSPGGTFNAFDVRLKSGQKLKVTLSEWNKKGEAIKEIESYIARNGSDTEVEIPDKLGKLYAYKLTLLDQNNKETASNFFGLYTPFGENHGIATASKSVYKPDETVSIYFENWGLNEWETGSGYQIFKKENGNWTHVKKDMAFTAEAITMPPHGLRIEHISLKKIGLDEGHYKVTKGFGVNVGENTEVQGFQLGVEFEIKK